MSIEHSTTLVEYREIPRLAPFGYRFGSDGTAWTCRKLGGDWRSKDYKPLRLGTKWRQLSQSLGKRGGYPTVGLWIDGKPRAICVHLLIAEAFHGPCPEGMEVCHNDGNPKNNRPDNLRYGTRRDNVLDRRAHGTDNRGERCAAAKLTEPEVIEIRRLAVAGACHAKLATTYNVSEWTIRDICDRRTWAHVGDPVLPERS